VTLPCGGKDWNAVTAELIAELAQLAARSEKEHWQCTGECPLRLMLEKKLTLTD